MTEANAKVGSELGGETKVGSEIEENENAGFHTPFS